jgi:hypothetical protein
MTLDDLPDLVSLDHLKECCGFTRADVTRRCPGAAEYGPADAPYYHRDDLAGLCEPERGTES